MSRNTLMSTTASNQRQPSTNEPIAVRIPEAVRVSGFSRSTLYLMAARGEIVFRKCGKAVLVDYASLKAAALSLPTATIRIAA
jgi:hypothetical protein